MVELAEATAHLWTQGILRDQGKLRRVENMATRLIPEHPAMAVLQELARNAA